MCNITRYARNAWKLKFWIHSFPEGIKLIKAERDPKLIHAIESLEILKSYNKNSDICLNNKIDLSESALLKIYCQNKNYLNKRWKEREKKPQPLPRVQSTLVWIDI